MMMDKDQYRLYNLREPAPEATREKHGRTATQIDKMIYYTRH
jgi:hypothetical protein